MSDETVVLGPVHDLGLPHAFVNGDCTYCPPNCPLSTGTSDVDAEGAVTSAPCAICGGGIPMRLSEYRQMLALGAPVIHATHGADTVVPVDKTYHATVNVYEVMPDGTQELVAATTAKGSAPSLYAAIGGPLSVDLQTKWLAMAERSSLADLPG